MVLLYLSTFYWSFHISTEVSHISIQFYFEPPISTSAAVFYPDYAFPGCSGGGRPSRRRKEGDGRDPAVCFDRQTPAKTDMERQVTQYTTNFVTSIDLKKKTPNICWYVVYQLWVPILNGNAITLQ